MDRATVGDTGPGPSKIEYSSMGHIAHIQPEVDAPDVDDKEVPGQIVLPDGTVVDPREPDARHRSDQKAEPQGGGVYRSRFSAQTAHEETDEAEPPAQDQGAGGPPEPPDRPPTDQASPYPDPEWYDGDGDGADARGDLPGPGEGREFAEPEFSDPLETLKRAALMARAGEMSLLLEGFSQGRHAVERQRAAEEAASTPPISEANAAPEPVSTPVEQAPPAAPPISPFVTLSNEVHARGAGDLPQRPPLDLSGQLPGETHLEFELRTRREWAGDSEPYNGPSIEVLERVLVGLRRPDVGLGQADPALKQREIGIVVKEPTPEEIAAAGGDVMAARAEKIARAQQETARKQQGPPRPDPDR
ncbi:MAG TPA: hypothetical protein VFT16_01205 [Candidatus Saccharimonadales bacterium]|nr:hypothetical protein [Candidatus Saccharimonadales bacterium]